MAGNPILLGTASGGATLVADAGSQIKTDEYGIQRGTIHHNLGDQANAQNKRFKPGSAYSGSLPQFAGFLVDEPADIIGGEGMTAVLPCTYARLDPLFVKLPDESQDIEYRDVQYTDANIATNIPVPHPLLTYKFAAAKRPNQRGTWATLSGAPKLGNYVFYPGGIEGVIGFVFIPLPADRWLCIKENVKPLCGGKLFAIEQQWKATYYFYGLGS